MFSALLFSLLLTSTPKIGEAVITPAPSCYSIAQSKAFEYSLPQKICFDGFEVMLHPEDPFSLPSAKLLKNSEGFEDFLLSKSAAEANRKGSLRAEAKLAKRKVERASYEHIDQIWLTTFEIDPRSGEVNPASFSLQVDANYVYEQYYPEAVEKIVYRFED